MLILDEKKIRKGKPIGLPYQGSKKKISKKIIEIIKQNFGTDKIIYDIFGGGGAITAEFLLNGLSVYYNDLDKDATDMFLKVISEDKEYLKTLLVSREEFFRIRDKDDKTVDDNLKLLINSFGNNNKDYLYGKEHADIKYRLALEIIKRHDVFSGYKQTQTWKNQFRGLQQLQQLQQLERLQQLQQLQQLQRLHITNLDYRAFSEVEGAIFYLDPPYENTTHGGYKGYFDSIDFYDWAYEMSKNNIVLISSYEISDSRFKIVYEFTKARSTLQGGKSGKKYEKLFMVK
ncbi:DNA adenine methylase [Streptococcus hyovaginalis]|uniref:DNA adenine methylase n=1 Tax=Streptococcus hyovaginalis TaxID=149015 RepID=UPI001478AF07|nr:DNA adenine methylase [Streptococcus hyovaginalis]